MSARNWRTALCGAVLGIALGSPAGAESGETEAFNLDEWDFLPPEEPPASRTQDPEPEKETAPAVLSLPEEDPAPVAARAAPAYLEEVIVTAQRRQESQQDTPISLAAFNAEQLELAGIDGLGDMGANVPALQIEPFPTSNATLRFYIRGIGIIDAQITQDPAVGVYADGVYIARSTGTAFDVADLERVEILRGPQGTLYGRNTTAGAINLISRRPSTDERWLRQSITVADRNTLIARSAMNLPLSETLALKVAVSGSTEDGYIDNTGPGGDYGDRESLSARLDLRWQPAPLWTLDYTHDYADIGFYNYQYQAVLTPEGNKGPAEQVKREAQANSIYSHRRLDSLATGMPLEQSTTEISGHALTVQRQFDAFDLKYIGAYRELREAFYTDLGGGAGSTAYRLDTHRYAGPAAFALQGSPTPLNIPVVSHAQWSHELQAIGRYASIDYVAGLFWFSERGEEDWLPVLHQFSAALSPAAAEDPTLGDLFRLGAPRIVSFTSILNEMKNESLAAYGQASWTPPIWSQRLQLTGGYRHTEDQRWAWRTKFSPSYAEVQSGGEGTAIALPNSSDVFDRVPGHFRFSDDSISLMAEYALKDDANLYGKYVEAYKSGGFNVRDPQIDGNSGEAADGNTYGYGFADGFDKELVKSFELGLKSEWLDRRLRLNADVFYTAYEDMQVNFILAGTISDTKTTNAGEARMWGLEIDANALLTENLRLDFSYAYLDARITKVLREVEEGTEDVTDRFQFNSAPRHTASLSLDSSLAHLDWGELRLNLNWQFTDEREGGVNAGKPVDLPAYQLLNLNLGIDPHMPIWGSDFRASVWVRNVLDVEYENSAIDNLPHADRAVTWGAPRSIGLDLRFDFN